MENFYFVMEIQKVKRSLFHTNGEIDHELLRFVKDKMERIYCRYCGARLKKDHVGKYCPTKNCQWSYTGRGYDKEEDKDER